MAAYRGGSFTLTGTDRPEALSSATVASWYPTIFEIWKPLAASLSEREVRAALPQVASTLISPGYLRALRVPLRSGRDFSAADGPHRLGWRRARRCGSRLGETMMSTKQPLTSIGRPVPELPVIDVERAQRHYRDSLGFEIGWLEPGKEIGAVSRGEAAIFLRKRSPPFEPAVHWVFAEDVDATYEELKSFGAKIVEPLEEKPWGLRQFTVEDLDGNRFYFHHD